jgi:hypothetical protein
MSCRQHFVKYLKLLYHQKSIEYNFFFLVTYLIEDVPQCLKYEKPRKTALYNKYFRTRFTEATLFICQHHVLSAQFSTLSLHTALSLIFMSKSVAVFAAESFKTADCGLVERWIGSFFPR